VLHATRTRRRSSSSTRTGRRSRRPARSRPRRDVAVVAHRGNVAATGGIASLLRRRSSPVSSTRGEDHVHISLVAQRVILLVLFDERSSLGLVRLRVRKAANELTAVLEALIRKMEAGSQPSVFAEITDADIDNLFND
jgi:hypothetical protein